MAPTLDEYGDRPSFDGTKTSYGIFMRLSRTLLLNFMLLSGLTFVSMRQVHADSLEPDQVRITTPSYRCDHARFDPPLGVYTYEASWQGIPAAELNVSISRDEQHYSVVASAKTYSGIDLLYKLRYRAVGLLSVTDFKPIRTSIRQQENSKVKLTDIEFADNGLIRAKREQIGKDDLVSVEFNPNNFTLDPFAAAFLARGFDWDSGETAELDAFNGKSRYLIQLTPVGKEMVEYKDEKRLAWVIEPRVSKLTDPEADKKLRSAKIYLSADKDRDVLKIVSSVFVGSVKTELESFRPSAGPATRVASAKDGKGSFVR